MVASRSSWRRNKRRFNGAQEMDSPLEVLNGDEIMRQLECVVKRARTGQKLPSGEVDWKKQSVLYDLPYWKDQLLRHNIYVMHTEKKNKSKTTSKHVKTCIR
jgi:hypothetical protein